VCYFLYLATPLTLSEVRAMLPRGLAADPLPTPDQLVLRKLLPDAMTGVRILHGGCACDLFLPRDPDRQDERHLRRRYFAAGFGRDEVIRYLDRHRRALELRAEPAGHWPRALVDFVAEHARNAGPSLYLRQFSADGELGPIDAPPATISVAEVRADPAGWLPDDQPVIVDR
jgi:hypothetical protein